jgi:hypothetical protein
MAFSTTLTQQNETHPRLGASGEALLAELTEAAYDVALRHKVQGNFLDVQLEMWSALRQVFEKVAAPKPIRCLPPR